MYTAQFTVYDIIAFLRLRWKLLAIPTVVVTVLCTVGAFLVPRVYESSIRILLQKAEVANPLTSLANAFNQVDYSDPLQTFNEIIYSDRTYLQVMDSLGITRQLQSELDRRNWMVKIRKSIRTSMEGAQTFRITFEDGVPYQAQRGAAVTASIYISTITSAKSQRNQLTVEFYEKKLEDFRQKMDESQNQLLRKVKSENVAATGRSATIYQQIVQLDQRLADAVRRIGEYHRIGSSLNAFPRELSTKEGRQALFEIQRSDVPYASDLRAPLLAYEDASARYTDQHPEVLSASNKIMEVLDRVTVGINAEISKRQSESEELRKTKAGLISELLGLTRGQRADDGIESNYMMYRRLYDEMKLKLEEAQITKVLESNLESHYVVMDEPLLPLTPTKPSRKLIVVAGFALGVVLGLISAVVAEFLDTTIRSGKALALYSKPVIAYLPEGKRSGR